MPTLGYWKIRGLAQSIRLVLAYADQEFEETKYDQRWDEKKQEWDLSEWFDVKHKLGIPFPNLPYLIDGDIHVTESNAILSYLGRKFDLMGQTEQARVYNDMLLQLVFDVHWKFFLMAYDHYDEQKDEYIASLPASLKPFADFLGEKPWFTGEGITVSDFHMYEILDALKQFEPKCLKEFGNLQKFCVQFEEQPTIQAYMKSDKFMKAPLHSRMAKWGNV